LWRGVALSKADLLIQGGQVIDGTGAPAIDADLAISNGRIAAIGPKLAVEATRVIDARGQVVSPGFIDIKTHSDWTLPLNPKAESKIRQGVTTEVIGHCGYSCAPALPGKAGVLKDYLSPSAPWLTFIDQSFADYLGSFPKTSTNVVPLVGHNTLRLMVMGLANRHATNDEIAQMAALVEAALDAGAQGLSTGLFTPPGAFAATEEIVTLAKIVKQKGGLYFTHLRDEANHVFDALDEAIRVGSEAGIHVQVVHMKLSGLDNWGRANDMLDRIERARSQGVAIDCDQYPYTAASNPLKNLLPRWVQSDKIDEMIARLSSPENRARIRQEIAGAGLNNFGRIKDWEAIRISVSPNQGQFAGRTIADLAQKRGIDGLDCVCDYLIADKCATRVLVDSISEDDIQTMIKSPMVCVGSDGNCVAPHGITGQGMPHPRFYGTFPRIIGHYCQELHLVDLPLAIRKMTGASAKALGFADRGLLKRGYAADVTIFDPAEFRERATYQKPHQFPAGDSTTVLVNGVVTVDRAEHTGALAGTLLKRAVH
jgi:N-acyl-D-amino-acid deacylase